MAWAINNGPGPSPICKVYEASQLALGTWPACGICTSEAKTFTGEAAKMHGEFGKIGTFFLWQLWGFFRNLWMVGVQSLLDRVKQCL